MKKTLKRSLSILLSLAMIVGLFAAAPISANAEITVTYLDADGTLKSADVTPLTSKDLTPGWYAVMSDITFDDRMSCSGDVHLILCDGCTLTANLGIAVNSNDSLTIYGQSKGTGRLHATNAAVFKGNYFDKTAAIGSDGGQNCGLVTINGGSIYANAGDAYGAAIGCGGPDQYGVFCKVVINGGNVEAISKLWGCCIGCGDGGGSEVTINGGIINATHESLTSAIGGGFGSHSSVTINGGEVNATSSSGPAIGCWGDNSSAVININGGIVKATTVKEESCDVCMGARYGESTINLSWTNPTDRIIFNKGGTSGTVTLKKAFTDGTNNYAANTVNPSGLRGNTLMPYPVVEQEQFDVEWKSAEGSELSSETIPEGTHPVFIGEIPEKPNSEFAGWTDKNGDFFEEGDPLPAINADKTYTATYRVNYTDENGIEQTLLSSAYREVTSSGASVANWTAGWYVLTRNVDFGSNGVSVNGDVKLVLCDECTLTVPEGIELKSESAFTIYCQQQGTGQLVVNDADNKTAAIGVDGQNSVKNITINGGIINVTGGPDAPAIGAAPVKTSPVNITINGGTVNATGGVGNDSNIQGNYSFSAGIGSYPTSITNVTINGGTVTATGGVADNSAGIFAKGTITINGGNVTATNHANTVAYPQYQTNCGIGTQNGQIKLSWTNTRDSIESNSYSGTVRLERPFVSNGTVYRVGTANNNSIAGKLLTPSYTERNVTIGQLSHGTVTVDSAAQVVGNTVKLNVTPDSGYMISKVMCDNTQLTPVNGVYSFVMPDADVTVTAEFVSGDIDLVVGGIAVNGVNCGDIFGNGTASYDYDTNTLSLNDARIEIAKYKDFPKAFGIRYNVERDIPFKISLSGYNVIYCNSSDGVSTEYGIALMSTAPGYEITGGTLLIDVYEPGNTKVCGIHTRKDLTVNGTQLTENIITGGTANGVELYYNSPVLTPTNGANISLDTSGSSGAAIMSSSSNANITVGTSCAFTARSENSAVNNNISLQGENYVVTVNAYAIVNGASRWDGTTSLGNYKYIKISKNEVIADEAEHGTVTVDKANPEPGEQVTVTAVPEAGYHLDSVTLDPVGEITPNEISLAALSGNNSDPDNNYNFRKLVDGNSGSKWIAGANNIHIILDAQNKVRMFGYSLITDNENNNAKNWKDYTIYGANFASPDQVTRNSSEWQVIKAVVDDNVLEGIDKKRYYFPLDNPAEPYRYYKIEVSSNKGGTSNQMAEFIMEGEPCVPEIEGSSNTRTFTMSDFSVRANAVFSAHTYGEPVWTWANDYSTASAEFTCTECGETQTVDASVTSEASGKKTVYTAAVTVNGVEYTDSKSVFSEEFGEDLAGCTLRLDGEIGVNFFMELSDTLAESQTAYMQFTLPNGDTPQVMVKDVKDEPQIIDGRICYVFSCSVAAKEMTSKIKAQLIDGTNEGTQYTYTVKHYANAILNDDTKSEATKNLVKAMLNYGAAAQTLFAYKPTDLPNTDIGDFTVLQHTKDFDEKELSTIINAAPSDMALTNISLILESQTALRLYFTSGTNPDIIETYEENGETKTRTYSAQAKGSEVYYEITGFAPCEIFASRTLQFDGANVSFDVTIGNYANWAVKTAGNEALAATILALYNYDEYAKAYVDNNYTPGQGGIED